MNTIDLADIYKADKRWADLAYFFTSQENDLAESLNNIHYFNTITFQYEIVSLYSCS